MTARPRIIAAFAVVLTCLWAASSDAQERLLLLRPNGLLVEVDTADESLGAVQRVTQLPPGTLVFPLVGGRYLGLYLWDTSSAPVQVGLFDLESFGIISSLTLPAYTEVFPDPFHPRVFYRRDVEFGVIEVGVIEAPTFLPRPLRFDSSTLFNLTYAGGLDALIGLRFIALDRYAIATVDVSTGELRTRATLDGGPISLLVDSEARRLYVSMWVERYSYIEIRAYDLDSFELLGKTGPYSLPSGAWSLDSTRHQLLIRYNSSYATFIGSLDANLSPKAFVDFRYLQFGQHSVGMAVVPSTVRNRTFAVLTQGPLRDNLCPGNPHCPRGKAFLVALAADTLQPVTTVDLLQSSPVFQPEVLFLPVLLQPPPPPRPLASAVSDRRVQLTWPDPGDTTHFMVEVGTIPGRSNLGILHVGNVTTWSVENVPSGTYYVRVRAGNYIGPSLPSNEVVVTVP